LKFCGHHIYFGLFLCNIPISLCWHLKRPHGFCQKIYVWYHQISKEGLPSDVRSFVFSSG
jgi:hypothetical protein